MLEEFTSKGIYHDKVFVPLEVGQSLILIFLIQIGVDYDQVDRISSKEYLLKFELLLCSYLNDLGVNKNFQNKNQDDLHPNYVRNIEAKKIWER